MAPEKGSAPIRADSMVLAPEGNSVIVANPADKVLYYYTEGMAAPMGDFQNYQREPARRTGGRSQLARKRLGRLLGQRQAAGERKIRRSLSG